MRPDDDADLCPWTRDAKQAGADGDGRGELYDARDDRPPHPGAGSFEAAQAAAQADRI
ncbi:hypothetical protein [Georgenia sp. AZ-5]|uniref:hypothetical protein n=1 Tax=Georgenia sp. AZ-5 TaxID=3367526 RepID=UPI00375456F0